MLLYYITDRRQLPGSAAEQRRLLLLRMAAAAGAGVDFIQLREKELPVRELETLAREAVAAMEGTSARLLVNSRVDVALSCGGAGVHLRADDILASDARAIAAASRPNFMVAVSCHSAGDVRTAWSHGADFAVFAPVFEKNGAAGTGLDVFRQACNSCPLPVFALGGVTLESFSSCISAGAAGIAAIRMFQEGDVASTVRRLRQWQQR